MNRLLSIKKNNARSVTITVPLNQEPDTTNLINFLTNTAITYDLTLILYKLESQKIIVFYFQGNEDSIKELIKKIEGLN